MSLKGSRYIPLSSVYCIVSSPHPQHEPRHGQRVRPPAQLRARGRGGRRELGRGRLPRLVQPQPRGQGARAAQVSEHNIVKRL